MFQKYKIINGKPSLSSNNIATHNQIKLRSWTVFRHSQIKSLYKTDLETNGDKKKNSSICSRKYMYMILTWLLLTFLFLT